MFIEVAPESRYLSRSIVFLHVDSSFGKHRHGNDLRTAGQTAFEDSYGLFLSHVNSSYEFDFSVDIETKPGATFTYRYRHVGAAPGGSRLVRLYVITVKKWIGKNYAKNLK